MTTMGRTSLGQQRATTQSYPRYWCRVLAHRNTVSHLWREPTPRHTWGRSVYFAASDRSCHGPEQPSLSCIGDFETRSSPENNHNNNWIEHLHLWTEDVKRGIYTRDLHGITDRGNRGITALKPRRWGTGFHFYRGNRGNGDNFSIALPR